MAKILDKQISNYKGNTTIKLLVGFDDNLSAEVALIKRETKNIICFSTMIGCMIQCKFCTSGIVNKYKRILTSEEMLSLIDLAKQQTNINNKPVIYSAMGEGEPSLNITNIIEVFNKFNKVNKINKFAISTMAPNKKLLINMLEVIAKQEFPIKVQYSLHTYDNKLRKVMIPGSNLSIKETLQILTKFITSNLELNVVLIKDLNDSNFEKFIPVLSEYGKPWYIKLNKFNKIYYSDLEEASNKSYLNFIDILTEAGHTVEYYETDGSDINAACGQLHYKI